MALFLLALAVSAVLTIASLIYLTRQALIAFRDFKRLGREAGGELDRISATSEQIERHLALAAESGTQLEASLERLRESRAQLTVLTSALAEVKASVRRVTGVVPRK
jgi:hypothetical protein